MTNVVKDTSLYHPEDNDEQVWMFMVVLVGASGRANISRRTFETESQTDNFVSMFRTQLEKRNVIRTESNKSDMTLEQMQQAIVDLQGNVKYTSTSGIEIAYINVFNVHASEI